MHFKKWNKIKFRFWKKRKYTKFENEVVQSSFPVIIVEPDTCFEVIEAGTSGLREAETNVEKLKNIDDDEVDWKEAKGETRSLEDEIQNRNNEAIENIEKGEPGLNNRPSIPESFIVYQPHDCPERLNCISFDCDYIETVEDQSGSSKPTKKQLSKKRVRFRLLVLQT